MAGELARQLGLKLDGELAAVLRQLKLWGRLDEAMALLNKQEAICVELGNQHGLQACHGNQALILRTWGRLDEAMALLNKQQAICVKLGYQQGLQACCGNQAVVLKDWWRLDEAMALLKKQEAICLDLGDQEGLALCNGNWAALECKRGNLKSAREKLERTLAIFSKLKMPAEIEKTQRHLDELNSDIP